MKIIFFSALLIVTLIFAGCSGGHEHGTRNNDASKRGTKLVVGLDDQYAPFSFRDNSGELVGFDIDLAEEVAERMGVEIEFKPIDWNTKEVEFSAGHINVLWSGTNITDERKNYMLFTKPYMENRQVVLVRRGEDQGIYTAGDLEGKIVGTQLGAPSDEYLTQDKKLKNSFAKFVTYDTYTHAFKALADGEVDAVICDELVVRYEMNRHHDKFDMREVTVGSISEIAVGFSKYHVELRDRVQAVLDEIIHDGTAKEISERWFNADLIKSGR